MRAPLGLLLFLATFFVLPTVSGLGEKPYVVQEESAGALALVRAGGVVPVHVEAGDWPGVVRAVGDLQADFQRVTGLLPARAKERPQGSAAILIGTLGRSGWVDTLEKSGKLNLGSLQGKWESNVVQIVEQPWPGLERALVIVGSDKRGTLFGLYGLSEQIGVSPWHWWADVPSRQAKELWVLPGAHGEGEPAVQYRGIFLNDEAPALTGWAHEKFGGYNREFYTRLFQLMLRLRANYLWPAMWNNAFNEDDPLNPVLADEYGIVMGTSHHEPMVRAHKEWTRNGTGPWDYQHNEKVLSEFWSEGIRRNRNFESIVTLGMRGDGDEPMSESENVALLEKIVADQRSILKREMNEDLTQIPQVWALYKEVQGYYERGMRVPDDVILLWCDDNWGNIRRLPTPEEENRKGGAGVYFHFDYVGGPRSYKWLNTNPLPKIWQQMEQAYQRKANRIWIVNVGDLKLMEFPTEFFLTLARNPAAWPYERLEEYTHLWATREFGADVAAEVSSLMHGYARINGMRKPELLSPETWSLINYDEAERIVAEYESLARYAVALREKIRPEARDAYFQLVEFPVRASSQVLALHVASAKTRLYGFQGRSSTNRWADRAEELFGLDEALTRYFHTEVAGGKWNHIASQTHLGYTYWQQPPRNVMPPVQRVQVPAVSDWGVTVEGTDGSWPTDNIHLKPPVVRPLERQGQPTRWIELFPRGSLPAEISITPSVEWLLVSTPQCILDTDTKIMLSVDWSKAPLGASEARVNLAGAGQNISVRIPILNTQISGPSGGYLEGDGVVAMEAGGFVRAASPAPLTWKVLPGLGRHREGLTSFPTRAAPSLPDDQGAWVEYTFHVAKAGPVKIHFVLEPGLDHQPGHARFAASLNAAKPMILEGFPQPGAAWEKAVSDAAFTVTVSDTVTQPGWQTLRFWRIDPGVVLLRTVVDTGGLLPSYLGPLESQRLP